MFRWSLFICFHCRVLSGFRYLVVDNHRTTKYTMLLPFGRDTVLGNMRYCSHSIATPYYAIYDVAPIRSRHRTTQYAMLLPFGRDTALRNIRCCSHSVATPYSAIYDVAPIRSLHRTLLVRCYEKSHLYEVIYRSPLISFSL